MLSAERRRTRSLEFGQVQRFIDPSLGTLPLAELFARAQEKFHVPTA